MNWTERIHNLLEKLEKRALQCPGLYPVRSSADFKRIVSEFLLHQRDPESVTEEETASWLEQIWRHPELAYQLNSQSLIRNNRSPFNPPRDDLSR